MSEPRICATARNAFCDKAALTNMEMLRWDGGAMPRPGEGLSSDRGVVNRPRDSLRSDVGAVAAQYELLDLARRGL